jgi:hypothetical protein
MIGLNRMMTRRLDESFDFISCSWFPWDGGLARKVYIPARTGSIYTTTILEGCIYLELHFTCIKR